MRLNIVLLSGEVSGDVVGGALAGALKRLQPDLALWGIGSQRMQEAGVDLIHNSATWGSIGYTEAIKLYPFLRFKMLPKVQREIDKRQPALAILIDFGAFNMHVARWCHAHSVPVLYYFPPGSWRRSGRVPDELCRIVDWIAAPFPWSADRLKKAGARAEFVGHPLLEIARPSMTRPAFAERYGLDIGNPIIGLLPGSRGFEIEHNMPVMLGAARLIRRRLPGAQFVIGAASQAARQQVELILSEPAFHDAEADTKAESWRSKRARERHAESMLVTPEGVVVPADLPPNSGFGARLREQVNPLPLVLVEGASYDVMAHSDTLIVCSGTATLEAAILGTPMVIVYRGSKLLELEARLRRYDKLDHFGMPNIVAGERIVPEYLQHDANPRALAEESLRFLTEPDTRARLKGALSRVRDSLGTPGASERVARKALELAGAPASSLSDQSD